MRREETTQPTTAGGDRSYEPGRWMRVVRTVLLVKLAYAAVVAFMVWEGEASFERETARAILRTWFPRGWQEEGRGRWERHFATWDAEHYLYLSAEGYNPNARSIAFYPLWPLLVRWTGALTGWSHVVVGLALANFFSAAGWCLFHRVVARRWGERVADVALASLIAFPGSLFFQFIYSESLFFLLLMVLWWAMERGRFLPAWCAAYLAPLARGVGVFGVIPLAWQALFHLRGRWVPAWRWWREEQERVAARGIGGAGRSWVLLVAPVLGWLTYLGLMKVWTGNAWAGVEAQKYWGVHAISHLWDFRGFWESLFDVRSWHEFHSSLLDRVGFVVLVYSLPVQWFMGRDLLAWTMMLGVVPALSGRFVSYIRFESCAFPLFVALGGFLGMFRRLWPTVLWVGLNLGVHLHLLWRFLNYRWAG